jgi:DinB superfamily
MTKLLPLALALAGAASAFAQAAPPTPERSTVSLFTDVNRKILDMAQDFPEDRYGFKPKPEMRSFGEVIVHIASGNVFAAKRGRGENVNWDELNPKDYKTKADIVALLKKSIDDSNATLKSWEPPMFQRTIEPWAIVSEHSAEHYGLLVAYYRLNGLVPPESRPKK